MVHILHELIVESATRTPIAPALTYQTQRYDFAHLANEVIAVAGGLLGLGLRRGERVAVYMEKRFETVVAMFGAAAAGGVFVPVNPVLKVAQVTYILKDCNVRILVTSAERRMLLAESLKECDDLRAVIVVGSPGHTVRLSGVSIVSWEDIVSARTAYGRTASSTPTWRRSSIPRAAPASPKAWCCPTATWSPAHEAWRSISKIMRATGSCPRCR